MSFSFKHDSYSMNSKVISNDDLIKIMAILCALHEVIFNINLKLEEEIESIDE